MIPASQPTAPDHLHPSLFAVRPVLPQPGRLQRLHHWLWQRGVVRQARVVREAGGTPKPQHLLTGERGEDEAYWFLRGLGYIVVARRWRSSVVRGDLDLVAWDGAQLVVVEVKTRTARDRMAASFAVDDDKQQQLARLVRRYMRALPRAVRGASGVQTGTTQIVEPRFDLVSVYLLPGGVEIEHQPAAFDAPQSLR